MIKLVYKKLESLFFYLRSLLFEEVKLEGVLAPAIGDIIEYEDETRAMVAAISIEDDMWDVRFSKSFVNCINQKGRQRAVLQVSKEPEVWPPINAKVFRDGKIVIPEKKRFKLKLLNLIKS